MLNSQYLPTFKLFPATSKPVDNPDSYVFQCSAVFISSSRKMGVLGHYDSFWTTFPKIKEKNINLRKNKNKKFIFFIGQEIKKPDLSGQNRSNPQNPQNPQNPDKTGQIRSNPEILPRTLTLAHFGPL